MDGRYMTLTDVCDRVEPAFNLEYPWTAAIRSVDRGVCTDRFVSDTGQSGVQS